MNDHEKIIRLREKLEAMQREAVTEWDRPIYEVALRAVEDKIIELGRRIRNRSYFLGGPPEYGGEDATAA